MKGDVIGGVIDLGEYAVLDAMRDSWRWIPSKPVIWDVGANVGDWSLAALRRFPAALVWAFEPQAGAYGTLTRTFAEAQNVTVANLGLSSHDETALLYKTSHPACYLASTVAQSGHRLGVQIDHTEEADFRRGETVMEAARVDTIHLLKIDVEGHELEVLDGFGDALVHWIDMVQFEHNAAALERGVRFEDLWAKVTPQFHVFRLDPDGAVSYVPEYDEAQEDDKQRNYLCVHVENDWFRWEPDRPVQWPDCRRAFVWTGDGR